MIEKQIHLDAFEAWFLEPNRNYSPVARKFKVSVTSIKNWHRRYKWEARAAKRTEELKRKTDRQAVETIADMNARHLKEYRFLQAKGAEKLKVGRIEKDRDAITALDTGIKGERTIRGEPTEIIDQRVEGGILFEFGVAVEKKIENSKAASVKIPENQPQ